MLVNMCKQELKHVFKQELEYVCKHVETCKRVCKHECEIDWTPFDPLAPMISVNYRCLQK